MTIDKKKQRRPPTLEEAQAEVDAAAEEAAEAGAAEREEASRPVLNSNLPEYEPGSPVTVRINEELVEASFIHWSDKYPNVAKVQYGGRAWYRNLYAANGARLVVPRASAPSTHAPQTRREAKASRFDANERFEFIETLCDMVVVGESRALIVTGDPGLGKTHTVMARLQAGGLTDVDDFEENQGSEEIGLGEHMLGDYKVIKGFSTPKSLFRLLWNHRKRVVVFDDCDSIWDHPVSTNILKATLDSYDRRRVSWLTTRKEEDDFPPSFDFEGKVIFVSNRRLEDLDAAVLSRCLYVDVSMTAAEKVERIRKVAKAVRPDVTEEMKGECIDLIAELAPDIGDLNIRTLLKVMEIRHAGGDRWRDMAEYVITAM